MSYEKTIVNGVEKYVLNEAVHNYFSLSYAQYLTLPRSVLQSMPKEWQDKFIELMEQLDDTGWRKRLLLGTSYKVELRKEAEGKRGGFKWGPKVLDPFQDYQRGRRDVFSE